MTSTDDRMAEIKCSLLSLTEAFRAPLEATGVDLCSIIDEIEDIVEYSRTYLRIGSDDYKKVWYQLSTSPDAVKWPNVLIVCELLFSLPFSTAKVERLFSTLKIIKNERRTSLGSSTLNDLLEVNAEGPTLANFSADSALICGGVTPSLDAESTRNPEKNTESPSKVQHLQLVIRGRNLKLNLHLTAGMIGLMM
jgi:hypothetical protein